jgi:ATP-dependent protease ClpP protease subunit
MVKSLAAVFASLVLITSFSSPRNQLAPIPSLVSSNGSKNVLVLSAKNTVVLDSEVTEESMAVLETKILEMSHKLSPEDHIILVLNTPGGEVQAGTEFIDFLHGIPQKVDTLTIIAASMGFVIAQSQNTRMILPNGVLMSHRAHGSSMPGDFNGSFQVRLKYILDAMTELETMCATRMDMSLNAYREMVRDEYWVRGAAAVSDKAADMVVLARCDDSLEGSVITDFPTVFGTVKVKKSLCPLITGLQQAK